VTTRADGSFSTSYSRSRQRRVCTFTWISRKSPVLWGSCRSYPSTQVAVSDTLSAGSAEDRSSARLSFSAGNRVPDRRLPLTSFWRFLTEKTGVRVLRGKRSFGSSGACDARDGDRAQDPIGGVATRTAFVATTAPAPPCSSMGSTASGLPRVARAYVQSGELVPAAR
jgi:hypothetical protein